MEQLFFANGIEEVKLLPSYDMKTLSLRLVRSSGACDVTEFLHELCKHLASKSCPRLQGAERTNLSGLASEPEEPSESESFSLETYTLRFD